MLKTILKRAGLGFLIGLPVGTVIAWCSSGKLVSPQLAERLGSEFAAVLLQMLCSGLYGAVTMAGMTLYDLERCPLALATGLHCLLVIVPYIPLALLLDWASSIPDILIVWCFQIIAFFIIWLIMWLRYKAEVKKLNELNQKRN